MNGKHNLRERGQAMMEYAVLFPMAIGILVMAWTIGYTNRMMYTDIVNAFIQPGIEETCEPIDQGPTVANLGSHRIELCGAVYNDATDVTTITYCVQNGGDPSISHWVLGVGQDFANSIISVSEQWEWTNSDPTTGVAGIKFDTGYESNGNDGGNDNNGGGNDNNGGGNDNPGRGRGNGNASLPTSRDLAAMKNLDLGNIQEDMNDDVWNYDGTARDVLILVSGQWEADEGTVTIKAGGETYYNTIRLPVLVTDNCEE